MIQLRHPFVGSPMWTVKKNGQYFIGLSTGTGSEQIAVPKYLYDAFENYLASLAVLEKAFHRRATEAEIADCILSENCD